MQVRIGDITAECARCHATEFSALGDGGRDAGLICRGCGLQASRAELLVQIGERASSQAAESLARLWREHIKRHQGGSDA